MGEITESRLGRVKANYTVLCVRCTDGQLIGVRGREGEEVA